LFLVLTLLCVALTLAAVYQLDLLALLLMAAAAAAAALLG
jgi:hypothetical protein